MTGDRPMTIPAQATLRDALARIERNTMGFVLAVDDQEVVVGLATDGDIRRRLLGGGSLDDAVRLCANADYVWADRLTPREFLLKQLDGHIRVIPILDEQRRLVGIVSRDNLPMRPEAAILARSRAPVRVSFGGGGSDLTHFFSDERGAVINATISLYSHAVMRVREDSAVIIRSGDLAATLEAPDLRQALMPEPAFGLIQAVLRVVQPKYGFELEVHSDIPMGSGLGGSAAVAAAVLGCFNELRRDRWDSHELAELAFQAERLYLGVAGGWQDQYAAVFGGFNFIEFRMEQNVVHPLRIQAEIQHELEENLLLCYAGGAHESGEIHADHRVQMQRDEVRRQVQAHVDLTYRMRDSLLRGKLFDFGRALDEAWQIKRSTSQLISTTQLDALYAAARDSGAIGGKLLGAGGGGFFLFYAPAFAREKVRAVLAARGIATWPFRFEPNGLVTWTVRDNLEHSIL